MSDRSWIVAVVAVCGAYWMLGRFVDAMTFHPARFPSGEWDVQESLRAEDVELRSPDGFRLHAWLVPAHGEARATTLYLHGNGENLSHRSTHLKALSRAGSETLILDYRGYGKSEGTPSEANLYEDAEAAYEWLAASGREQRRIVLYGESLGTAAATDLAARLPCGALVLEAPFPSRAAVASRVFPIVGPLLARGFETARKIKDVKCRVLILHGTADTVIPQELGRVVFDAAPEPKEFWSIPGGRHVDPSPIASKEFQDRMSDLFAGLRVR